MHPEHTDKFTNTASSHCLPALLTFSLASKSAPLAISSLALASLFSRQAWCSSVAPFCHDPHVNCPFAPAKCQQAFGGHAYRQASLPNMLKSWFNPLTLNPCHRHQLTAPFVTLVYLICSLNISSFGHKHFDGGSVPKEGCQAQRRSVSLVNKFHRESKRRSTVCHDGRPIRKPAQ